MSRRRSTMGRGLAALIPDQIMEPGSGTRGGDAGGVRVLSVPLSSLRPNPEQPRTEFDSDALAELAASIREHGILNPLVARREDGDEGGYVLIAGERRYRAAGLAGLETVPVLLREDAASAEVQLELALVENLQREDLDPVEAARGYARLQQDYGYTQEDIARKVGKSRPTVANALRLLRLPDKILELVRDGRLSAGHAKALLPIDDEAVLREIVSRVLAQDLSVRATERLVRSRRTVKRSVQRSRRTNRALERVSELLTRSLSTAVEVRGKARGKGGRIVIDYYDNEDLERLINLLRGED